MNKLMFAAAAVAMATCAQAASIEWKWSVGTTTASYNGYDAPADQIGKAWSGAAVTGNMAYYLINADVMTQSQLLTAMRDGTDWSSAVLASGTTGASDGKIAKNPFTTTTVYTDGDPIPSVNLNAYAILVNDDADYVSFSATVTKAGDKSGGQVDLAPAIATSKILRDNTGTAAYSSPGWYAVPEPTSGLLLLLGVAGLALRRRRA